MHLTPPCAIVIIIALSGSSAVADDDLADRLRRLDAAMFTADEARARGLERMLARDVHGRVHAAIEREARAFDAVKTRADWERFRDQRLAALRKSLGRFPDAPKDLKVRITGSIAGEGYRIDKLVFESRPGLFVTSNLYVPTPPNPPLEKGGKGGVMPGILVCHSFFHPKSQPELQDIGVNFAKLGCLVLVPDLLGHGERRQHPFVDAASYAGKFNVPRQDYYGRANTGLQLHVAGESLMGWFVWDIFRCVDVLLSRPGIDREKIVVLGAVAAGGDPAGVAAALDPRISAVVPYNFGGPEPETPYPLPEDPEKSFPYGSGGHWDSTRRLYRSARDGFFPWLIVGSVAPRRLVYAHEFAWDRDHDPVWSRLKRIFELVGTPDHLAFAHGEGTLFGKPEGTGCGNIGAYHRKTLYPTFRRWFEVAIPEKEVLLRREPSELICLSEKLSAELKPRKVHEIAGDLADERLSVARKALGDLKPTERRARLRQQWTDLLGAVEPRADPKVVASKTEKLAPLTVERIALEVEAGIVVPLILLVPPRRGEGRLPAVVALSHAGKQGFLRERAAELTELAQAGVLVCLPDVRGTGETLPAGERRGPPAGTLVGVTKSSPLTLLANEDLMLGQSLLGSRLRDLRSVLKYLRGRPDTDATRIALWGDSFAGVNPMDQNLQVPWDAEKLPGRSEPLGGLLALYAALFEDDVRAVAIQGSLLSYRALLHGHFCHVPLDAIVPGALTVSDLEDIAGCLAPRSLRVDALVDGANRLVSAADLPRSWQLAREAYRSAGVPDRLSLAVGRADTAKWLRDQLRER